MTTQTSKAYSASGIQKVYADLLKHSGIYGVAQMLKRFASLLLLPVYTSYLQPADYGCIALLDLMVTILGIVIGAGMGNAVTRYHFDAQTPVERDRVWWTGLTFMTLMATGIVGPVWLLRRTLAYLTLGPAIEQGGFYYTLVLTTLWFQIIGELPGVYLQVHKRSGTYCSISTAHLLINVGLNVFFLTSLHLGMVGLLLGNLITGGIITGVSCVTFCRSCGPYAMYWPLVRRLWRFSSPLIVTALLAAIMHQADRYLLRLFVDMEHIGLYSLAYTMGQAINTLYLLPFSTIWGTVVYDIARRPDAKEVYAQIFQYFIYGLALIMLGTALFARPLLTVIVAPQYVPAADLIPIVCLAYLFFSLHEHFKVPVLLAKRTTLMPPVFVVATVANIGMNLLLIPLWGTAGAAWASVGAFAIFSFTGLWRYRTIDRYPYPLLKCGVVVVGMSASYAVHQVLARLLPQRSWGFAIAVAIWVAWGIVLFRPFIGRLVWRRQRSTRQDGRRGVPSDYVLTAGQD
jgi:O-antigen/teichoic acid export membrane protein